MKKSKYTISIGLSLGIVLGLFSSCFKEEPMNMECDILEAWVPDGVADNFFYSDADRHLNQIASDASRISFTVKQTTELPAVPVYFRLTEGATIVPENGSSQDFSQGTVTYTVTSEDGQWKRIYEVSMREIMLPPNLDFENFDVNSKNQYYEWFELGPNGERNYIWASGNVGYLIARPNAAKEDYPTTPDENGMEGYCLKLTTRSTGSWGKTFKKPIAAGNFFLGSFDTSYAFTNTLLTTRMGIPFTSEPVRVTGFYKYQPGAIFTDKDAKTVEGRIDEPNIYSVLYINHDEEGNAVVLHGDDVLTIPLIVRKAVVGTLPATDEWTPFELTYEGDTPIDAEMLANRGYSLALVFSSSKTGDAFEGAEGSTLYIDNVKMFYQE